MDFGNKNHLKKSMEDQYELELFMNNSLFPGQLVIHEYSVLHDITEIFHILTENIQMQQRKKMTTENAELLWKVYQQDGKGFSLRLSHQLGYEKSVFIRSLNKGEL